MNRCIFSECRTYRYVLDHDASDLLSETRGYSVFIGLNPSKADENQLDPTLRRIKNFSISFGYPRFVMLNLFAIVSTDPKVMLLHPSPIGPENDRYILRACQEANLVVCAWGSLGRHMAREAAVLKLLSGIKLKCLGITGNGSPAHPLYLSAQSRMQSYPL